MMFQLPPGKNEFLNIGEEMHCIELKSKFQIS